MHSLVVYLIQYKSDGHVIRRIAGFFLTLSLFNILLITFLRFFAIFWPIKYHQDMTKAKIKKLIATIWILSLAVLPAVLYTFKKRKLGPPLAIIIFSLGAVVTSTYTMIAIKIFQLLKRKQFDWKNEHRVLLNSAGVTMSYFACFSPFAAFTMILWDNTKTK